MLRKVGGKGTVKVDEAKDPKEYKKSEKREMKKKKMERKTNAICKGHDMTGVDWEKTWQWIGRGTSRAVQKL